jgi:RHS repeat-associated protein
MEKDPEIKGEGNSYTTEFRQYDPRLGRWLSLDPLMSMFPWQSPYCAFDNNPVYYTDPLGLAAEGGPGDGDKKAPSKYDSGTTKGGEFCSTCPKNPPGGQPADNTKVDNQFKNYPKLDIESQKKEKERYQQQLVKQAEKNTPTMKPTPSSEQMEMGKQIGKDYEKVFEFAIPGLEIIHNMQDGEEISASDIFIEGIGAFPFGKLVSKGGKLLLKVGDKTTDVTKSIIRTKSDNALNALCFVEGTKICTKDGLKNIEEIKVGDYVWSFSDSLNKKSLKMVYNIVSKNSNHIQRLFIGNETISTTDDHPFYVSGNWKKAQDLSIGDTLSLLNGEYRLLKSKERIDTNVIVYNFAVTDYHTYYVGEQSVLVHNNGCAAVVSKVENMSTFFKSTIGVTFKNSSSSTKKLFQGQVIYKVDSKMIEYNIRKGDVYYLDGLHKDHLEVFDSTGLFRQALNLDGTINAVKTAAGQGRRIKL